VFEAAPGSLQKARELADAGCREEALAVIDSALSQKGPDAALYHLKGAVLLSMGNDEEAEGALRRAIYLDPGHHESLTHLELLSHAKGHTREAALLADRAKRAKEPLL
jgi:chemotaxis protein methyltransferase WspC